MSEGGTSYQDQLAELRRSYVVDARADGDELRAILAGAQASGWEEDARKRFRKLAHDLRGSGGAYGFGAISETAAVLEDGFLDGAEEAALGAALETLIGALDDAVAQEAGNS